MTGYSPRAVAIMARTQSEQRRAPRTSVHVSGTVVYSDEAESYLVLTRDVSPGGVFFYCDRTPALGVSLTITFDMPVLGRGVRVVAFGRVIRIERFPTGGVSGVAARFDLLNIPELAV
jgi:hypothetical protein